MSEIPFHRTGVSAKPGLGQAVLYRSLVGILFVVSVVAVLIGRIAGAEQKASVWQEAREAAYAVAGYAFKY